MTPPAEQTEESLWSPLKIALFRGLWLATLASNLGTWIQDIGSGWLMTTLSPSPLMVSLVQTANTLPIFLLALPAGALADVSDRRKLLLFSQTWMFLAALTLALLTWFKIISPFGLLLTTFALGVGNALNLPAWQAVIPEVVPKKYIHGAVTLQGVGMNLARAVGPAIGGFIIASFGIAATFFLNALSFFGVILVLYGWKREPEPSILPSERFLGAMKAGFHYAWHSHALKTVLIRSASFMYFGTSLFALLPILVRHHLRLGPQSLGLLLGFMGSGALLGALLQPRLKARFSVDTLISLAVCVFAACLGLLSAISLFPALCLILLTAGICWIIILSGLNVAAQSATPGWVKARALSIYLLFFYGSMALGSLSWGSLASHVGVAPTLFIAGLGMLAGLLTKCRYRLAVTEGLDLTPSNHWPAPMLESEPHADRGPIMVQVRYHVLKEQRDAFGKALHQLKASRMRDGAIRWEVYQDSADGDQFVEIFVAESWMEHLRQHTRVTKSDQALQQALAPFLKDEKSPIVSHWLYYQDKNEQASL